MAGRAPIRAAGGSRDAGGTGRASIARALCPPGDFASYPQEKPHKISYTVSSATNSMHWPGEVAWAEMCEHAHWVEIYSRHGTQR